MGGGEGVAVWMHELWPPPRTRARILKAASLVVAVRAR